MDEAEKKTLRIKEILNKGVEITGESSGLFLSAATGLILGAPEGALFGAAAGPAITTVSRTIVSDLASRFLSQREEAKIGAGAIFAAQRVKANLDAGLAVRTDEFFEPNVHGRSDAEEILEGALLRCKAEHEERKARIYGGIFANVAFMNVPIEHAHQALRLAESLTYQQLCILTLAGMKMRVNFDSQLLHVTPLTHLPTERPGPEFLAAREKREVLIRALKDLDEFIQDITHQPKGHRGLTPLGMAFFKIMGLEEIPVADLKVVEAVLREASSSDVWSEQTHRPLT